jgi:hypothetical protein
MSDEPRNDSRMPLRPFYLSNATRGTSESVSSACFLGECCAKARGAAFRSIFELAAAPTFVALLCTDTDTRGPT